VGNEDFKYFNDETRIKYDGKKLPIMISVLANIAALINCISKHDPS
jgi:hypothetical protein